jgi:hypothetical protein
MTFHQLLAAQNDAVNKVERGGVICRDACNETKKRNDLKAMGSFAEQIHLQLDCAGIPEPAGVWLVATPRISAALQQEGLGPAPR